MFSRGRKHVRRVWRLFVQVGTEFCLSGRTQVRPPNLPVVACFGCRTLPLKVGLSALEGSFGRRRCRRTCMSFVSGKRLRPPNLHGFRLWKGPSAAESAAESALSSPFMVVFYTCFEVFLGGFWGVVYELFRVCLAPH